MPATDFDFLPGHWNVHNRKLVNTLDPDVRRVGGVRGDLDRLRDARRRGNHDHFFAAGYEGFSLRLYDPSATCGGSGGPPRRARAGSTHRSRGASRRRDRARSRPRRAGRRADPDALRLVGDAGDSARWDQSFSFDDG